MSQTKNLMPREFVNQLASGGLPLSLNRVFVNDDGVLTLIDPPRESSHRFIVDGMPFHVALAPDDSGHMAQIYVEIGHVPFTAEDPYKRGNLLAIMRYAQNQTSVRLILGPKQMIIATTQFRLGSHLTPEDLLLETVYFVKRTRPFIQLIGSYLH